MRSITPVIAMTFVCLALSVTTPLQAQSEALLLTHFIAPAYPVFARSTSLIGQVYVDATVKRDGSVTVEKVTGTHEWFVPDARECVKAWRFKPGNTDRSVSVTIYYCFSGIVRDRNPDTRVTSEFDSRSIRVYVITDPPPHLMF